MRNGNGEQMSDDRSQSPKVTAEMRDGILFLSGDLSVWTFETAPQKQSETIDVTGVTRLDTAGAQYLIEQRAAGAALTGLSPVHAELLQTIEAAIPVPDPSPAPQPRWREMLSNIGIRVVGALQYMRALSEYLGRFLAALARAIRHPSSFRLTSLVYHCQETGLRAVPVVVVMSFLIGVVLAFQGATQLKQFGAEIFVVDLIAISVLRELGILLTAIVVAGRTASALTASIGSMKMREEIDAMRTLGLDPDNVLVLPRVLALILTLPILGLISNLAALTGGAIMSWITLGVSPSMFLTRLAETDISNVIAGISKAPIFAVIIGIIGCQAGMSVGKDAESLGAKTSAAVVNAIFAVIIADALFSIFFSEVGI